MKREERTERIIEKVFSSLMREEATLEEVLTIWYFLGMFVFSEGNKLSEIEAMFKMSLFVKERYKEILAKSFNN